MRAERGETRGWRAATAGFRSSCPQAAGTTQVRRRVSRRPGSGRTAGNLATRVRACKADLDTRCRLRHTRAVRVQLATLCCCTEARVATRDFGRVALVAVTP